MKLRILVTEPEYFTQKSLRLMRKMGTVVAKRMTRAELIRAAKTADALFEIPRDSPLFASWNAFRFHRRARACASFCRCAKNSVGARAHDGQ